MGKKLKNKKAPPQCGRVHDLFKHFYLQTHPGLLGHFPVFGQSFLSQFVFAHSVLAFFTFLAVPFAKMELVVLKKRIQKGRYRNSGPFHQM